MKDQQTKITIGLAITILMIIVGMITFYFRTTASAQADIASVTTRIAVIESKDLSTNQNITQLREELRDINAKINILLADRGYNISLIDKNLDKTNATSPQ